MTKKPTALDLYDSGLTVIPIKLDGSKSPAIATWYGFINERPTRSATEKMFSKPCGLAVLGGPTSGNGLSLEIIDFDVTEAFDEWKDLVDFMAPGLLARLPVIASPNGRHVYYRSEATDGNKKLAMLRDGEKTKTKIETRGRGGYIIAPPSPPETHPTKREYKHLQGPQLTHIPDLTNEERQTLIDAARALNEVAEVEEKEAPRSPAQSASTEKRPGDLWAEQTTWSEILLKHGWKVVRSRGVVTYWQRPGKDGVGISATTGHCGDKLYVFSSNAGLLKPQRAYGKFSVYAWLNHNGDFSAAARALKSIGFTKIKPNKLSDEKMRELNKRMDSFSDAPVVVVDVPLKSAPPPSDEDYFSGAPLPSDYDAPPPSDEDAPPEFQAPKPKAITAEVLEAMLDDDAAAAMRPGVFERLLAMRSDKAEWTLIGEVLRRKKIKLAFNSAVKEHDRKERKIATVDADGWKSQLLYKENKSGDLILENCLMNLVVILTYDKSWLGVLAYDTFKEKIVTRNPLPFARFSGRQWSDADTLNVRCWIECNYPVRPNTATVSEAILVASKNNSFNSLREYFDGLEDHGGESVLDTWLCDFFGAPDTPYTRAVGAKWMISAVARAYEPGCKVDSVLILEGEQGHRKSTTLAKLCPDTSWFADGLSDFGSKAQAEEVEGKWIIELGEMKGFGKELEQIKAFVTRQVENYRPAYARYTIESPRKCVFAATVNPGAVGYFRDETGNRRYWPVECPKQGPDLTPEMRDRMWAEAKSRYLAGEKWWIDDEILAAQAAEVQSERVERDSWHEIIEHHLIGQQSTSTGECLEALKIDVAKRTRAEEMRVGRIITMLGWKRYQHRMPDGRRTYRYSPPQPRLSLVS